MHERLSESTCTVKEARPHATQAAWEAARETPAGSPTGQDERERTRQHAEIAEGGKEKRATGEHMPARAGWEWQVRQTGKIDLKINFDTHS
jgi:hypothetical protein